MNRFSMLTQLREDIKRGNDHGLNHNRFVLTGIIDHDSNDTDLIDCISANFVKWAEMTGENFLFITFIPPSNDWKKSKYCHDEFWYDKYDKNSLMVDKYLNNEKEERTIPLLREFLDLPQEGSYLMLADDICSNDFHKIEIDASIIEDKLMLITEYCNIEALGSNHTPADFKGLLKMLNAKDYLANEPLLDLLIDFVSISSTLVDNHAAKAQLLHADKVIEKLRKKLKVYSGTDIGDRVFHLFEAIEIVVSLVSNSKEPLALPFLQNINHDILIDNNGHRQDKDYYIRQLKNGEKLDNYSKKLYKSYYLISQVVNGREEDIDYSGLTIYLGKIVENELHLSIGQMLRWSMGIEMPKYFNKYCRWKRNVLVPAGNQVVNLNKPSSNGGNRHKGIPMGTLITVYNTMIKHPELVNPQPDSSRIERVNDNLIDFIKTYSSNYRNLASHLDQNSQVTYDGAKEKFELFLSQFFDSLFNIRIKLLGRPLPERNFVRNNRRY